MYNFRIIQILYKNYTDIIQILYILYKYYTNIICIIQKLYKIYITKKMMKKFFFEASQRINTGKFHI